MRCWTDSAPTVMPPRSWAVWIEVLAGGPVSGGRLRGDEHPQLRAADRGGRGWPIRKAEKSAVGTPSDWHIDLTGRQVFASVVLTNSRLSLIGDPEERPMRPV